jgi:hypothetical protein
MISNCTNSESATSRPLLARLHRRKNVDKPRPCLRGLGRLLVKLKERSQLADSTDEGDLSGKLLLCQTGYLGRRDGEFSNQHVS